VKNKYDTVYQFKIELDNIKPVIWRRIQVPEPYSFWDLHVAIQDSMGWTDSHLHQFTIKKPRSAKKYQMGIPSANDEEHDIKILASWEEYIAEWFTFKNLTAEYLYDFGDGWNHQITFEAMFPRNQGVKYPVCLAGERACPPEDVGGYPGYENFIEIMKQAKGEEYREMLEWYGRKYKPEQFIPGEVKFTNSEKRLFNLLKDQ